MPIQRGAPGRATGTSFHQREYQYADPSSGERAEQRQRWVVETTCDCRTLGEIDSCTGQSRHRDEAERVNERRRATAGWICPIPR